MYGHMLRWTVTCHDARSHVTMHGHMSRCRSHVMMHGHMSRCTKEICHDARSHVTMHGHMSRRTVTCHDARSHVTTHGHMNVKKEQNNFTQEFYSDILKYLTCIYDSYKRETTSDFTTAATLQEKHEYHPTDVSFISQYFYRNRKIYAPWIFVIFTEGQSFYVFCVLNLRYFIRTSIFTRLIRNLVSYSRCSGSTHGRKTGYPNSPFLALVNPSIQILRRLRTVKVSLVNILSDSRFQSPFHMTP
jgi:hypothetical protein